MGLWHFDTIIFTFVFLKTKYYQSHGFGIMYYLIFVLFFLSHLSDLRGLHMEKEHNDPSKLVFVKCDKCEYTSKSRGSLVNHKRIVHENYRPKKCDFPNCEKRFPTKSCLEDHIMRVHSANEILCNDCGKLFASPSMLRRHARWHHNPDKVGGE